MTVNIKKVKDKALELGWNDVGATTATIPEEDVIAYRKWISNEYQADMGYMENTVRCDPKLFFPKAKTAIIFVSYYKQPKLPFRQDAGQIASFARGRDYHTVHRKRLKKMIRWMEEQTGEKEIAKGFSGSAPILEKSLAVQAGLGWFGKNTLFIHRKFGSFVLLAGLLTTLELPDRVHNKQKTACGSCQRCIDACPMGAIVAPYQLDARKCLSYHLIESKNEIPQEVSKKNPGYLFGCDSCQNACPHNAKKPISEQTDFSPESGVGPYLDEKELEQLRQHPEKLYGTPLKRMNIVNG